MYYIIKKLLVLNIILITILFSTTTVKIDKNLYEHNKSLETILHIKTYDTEVIGNIEINKLNLNKKLYKIDSKENTIEKNIQILKESTFPDNENSIIFLAAHSGNSNISYFNELINLKTNDEIILTYKNKKYTYIINEIYEENKNGEISYNRNNTNQLILTTCHPYKENKQLIINSIQKEP